MKLLVADDSAIYRKMLSHLLESWGYEVLLAKDGNEALAILQSDNSPRIAILDNVMPGMTGPELCRAVRAGGRPYTYIILLSVNSQEDDVTHGFDLGADDYLCKPFKQFELHARLRVGIRIIESQDALLRSQEALQFQATHDALTRMWNRRGVMELLQNEASRATRSDAPLSVCLVDLDHFKLINDNYGHLVGDDVLSSCAIHLSDVLRGHDLVGRYGGEEFLVVLPGSTAEQALAIAERMRKSVGDEPLISKPAVIRVTASIGVSQWYPGMEIHELLREADLALYQAKDNGRNRVELASAQMAIPHEALPIHVH